MVGLEESAPSLPTSPFPGPALYIASRPPPQAQAGGVRLWLKLYLIPPPPQPYTFSFIGGCGHGPFRCYRRQQIRSTWRRGRKEVKQAVISLIPVYGYGPQPGSRTPAREGRG